MRYAIPVLLALAVSPAAVQADPLESLTGEGRYQLMEINDRIVRLDTQTGRFEMCRMENDDWKCLVAQDDRQRLEDTIATLSKRVAALEAARRDEDRLRQVSTQTIQTAPAASPAPSVAQSVAQPPVSVTVTKPVVAEATPEAPLPNGPITTASIETVPVPVEPVPAEPVPSNSGLAASDPAATGKPFDISPAATASASKDKPGLIDRITGLVPNLGW